MERRFFLKMLSASIASSSLVRTAPSFSQQGHGSLLPVKFKLSGAGRIGFYQDYSELSRLGRHSFYVLRTHGSVGNVSCTWRAFDSASGALLKKGSLLWGDGAMDIKTFSIDITNKPPGDHRIFVVLSEPTGGAELHHGENTVAYGIIDDGTIAISNAIFIDADAKTNGNGTRDLPYNNWYDARNSVSVSTRFIYIKGKLIPDGTDDVAMSNKVKHFALKDTFEGRETENQRLVIRNWPTFTGGIDGGGQTDCSGFVCDGGSSSTKSVRYITFRNLTITNLDNSDGGRENGHCYFIRTRGSGDHKIENWTAENIDIDGITSGANAANAVWYSVECSNLKLWRWSVSNTNHTFLEKHLDVFLCYRTDKVSIQRCSFEETSGGIYEKEGFREGIKVGLSLRFNHIKGGLVRISTQGRRFTQDFHLIQSNLFDTPERSHTGAPLQFWTSSSEATSTKQQISNNLFFNYSFSTIGDITFKDAEWKGLALYNNIFYESRRPWKLEPQTLPPEFLDFNHYYNETIDAPVFRFLSRSDISLEKVKSSTPYDSNSTVGDPKFTVNGWRLHQSSPCYNSGVGGTSKGLYLTKIEKIGAGDLSLPSAPSRMQQPRVSINQP